MREGYLGGRGERNGDLKRDFSSFVITLLLLLLSHTYNLSIIIVFIYLLHATLERANYIIFSICHICQRAAQTTEPDNKAATKATAYSSFVRSECRARCRQIMRN